MFKAFNANFSSPLILVQMGRCLVKMDAVEDAKVLYENALEIDSDCEIPGKGPISDLLATIDKSNVVQLQ